MNEKSLYLELLEKGNITPNFWCSSEYFQKANLKEIKQSFPEPKGFPLTLVIKDEDWAVFPPINLEEGQRYGTFEAYYLPDKIWSDFIEWNPPGILKSQFLDFEYIFNPKDFLSMEGGKWAIFRKNCRKWPRRFGNGNLTYDKISNFPFPWEPLGDVIDSWLTKKGEEEIQDDEVMLRYLFKGENRKALWDKKGNVYGINIWDSNYRYINFRYCICKPEDFLSEYMRVLFYQDPSILNSGKLVNDGGILDNPNLQKFKEKMNPVAKRSVFSWIL